MRCLSCEKLSFKAICNKCQKNLLEPTLNKRELEKDFFVYSFYNFQEIKELINTKYHFYGDRVYKIFGKLAFNKFAQNFEYPNKVFAVPIDDSIKESFSHTAVLAKAMQSDTIEVVFNTLKAKNNIKYAGKPLEFRKKNKREFQYSGEKNLEVILIDDIVTSGSTILEAKEILEKNGSTVLFALTLSDATDEKRR